MTPIERALRAKQLLNDEVFQEIMTKTRERLILQLEELPIGDHETQHEIALMLQLLKKIHAEFRRLASDADVEKARDRHRTFIAEIAEKFR